MEFLKNENNIDINNNNNNNNNKEKFCKLLKEKNYLNTFF